MADIKLTKNELRAQQKHLSQLQKYLPTLQLKKAMLQLEVNEVRQEIGKLREAYKRARGVVDDYSPLLTEREGVDLSDAAEIIAVNKRSENIAGVDVPYYESVTFAPFTYSFFETPPWLDAAVAGIRRVAEAKAEVQVAEDRKFALERELREVSIRVNLFEKILIPRAQRNIKKIKVFLGDQELAAVSQAKVAKEKIQMNKEAAKLALAAAVEKNYAN